MLQKLLLCGCAAGALSTGVSTLKYFGVWELEAADPVADRVSEFANFLFTSNDMASIKRFQDAGVGPSLLDVESTFFMSSPTGLVLHPDYQTRWSTLLESTVKPGLGSKTLFGVFFGDELIWNCLSYNNLTAAIDLVRQDLPRGTAVLYQNEAFPVFTGTFSNGTAAAGLCEDPAGVQHHGAYPSVPKGLDWISIDYYPDEGTIAGARKIYEELIYPKMSDEQSVLFVPPAYGASNYANTTDNATVAAKICCSQVTRDGPNPPCHGNCTDAVVSWALAAYDWAREDPRVIGLNPWHWSSTRTGPMFEPGLAGLPVAEAVYRQIGHEIVSGKLRNLA
eukprot:m.24187 g.24187  ORF g.24187 m.24187 type:complete len:336 (+) comp6038_c0_seq1:79-1086(+)